MEGPRQNDDADIYGNCVSVADRYEKLGRLGEGTYGIVYQARDRQTHAKVALKRCIPHHESSDGFPVTTLREIQSLRLCAGHPHIVQLALQQEVAVSRHGVFLVFEYW
jgi:serine/threonine protein kinase